MSLGESEIHKQTETLIFTALIIFAHYLHNLLIIEASVPSEAHDAHYFTSERFGCLRPTSSARRKLPLSLLRCTPKTHHIVVGLFALLLSFVWRRHQRRAIAGLPDSLADLQSALGVSRFICCFGNDASWVATFVAASRHKAAKINQYFLRADRFRQHPPPAKNCKVFRRSRVQSSALQLWLELQPVGWLPFVDQKTQIRLDQFLLGASLASTTESSRSV